VSDYDYLNARVRGMSTELLSREFYEQVLAAFTDTLLMDALLGSAYAAQVQQARERHAASPLARAIESAVWAHAAVTFSRLLSAAPPEPRRLLALQLNRWDAANVAALVRARLAGAEPHEALAAVLPIGELEERHLAELAAEPDLESLAEALTTWKHPVGFELRRAIRECPNDRDPRALERALHRAYFSWALAQLRADDPHQALVRRSIQRHVDLMNVVTILTRIRGRKEGETAEAQVKDAQDMFERGTLEDRFLAELAACTALEDAFEALASTWLGPGVEKGILTYGQSQSLGVMERFLEAVEVERACRLFREDMLSAAVPLGFLWRKYSECVNLRLLARGTLFHMPPAAVRMELVLV
jgi:vacuolar-type H+-ATPase subunit C/Vma6